jgi:hypothetical protein
MLMAAGLRPTTAFVAVVPMLLTWATGFRRGRLLAAGNALRVRVVPATPPNDVSEDDNHRNTMD